MRRIPLRNRDGRVVAWTTVDDEDYERLNRRRWRWSRGYAARGETRTVNGRRKVQTIYMHREVMGLRPGDGREVDHGNGRTRDNRRGNLEVVTHRENMRRARHKQRGVSRHRNVGRDGHSWRVVVSGFTSEATAARAAREIRERYL